MTCQELVDFLCDYLAEELPVAQREVFEHHLRACPPCLRFLESYRDTIQLGRCACTDPEGPVPADVPERLVEAIVVARRTGTQSSDDR